MYERTRHSFRWGGTLGAVAVVLSALLLPGLASSPAQGVANPFHNKAVLVSFPASGKVRVSVTASNSGIAGTGSGFVGEFIHLSASGNATFGSADGVTGVDGIYETTVSGTAGQVITAQSCNRYYYPYTVPNPISPPSTLASGNLATYCESDSKTL